MIENKERAISELKGTNFFYTLEPFGGASELTEFVQTLVGKNNYGINSSPLAGDRDNSVYWKRRWLEKYGLMPPLENLIFTGRKEQYAMDRIDGTPNVLVDDKPSNINRWNAKGGIGILYQPIKIVLSCQTKVDKGCGVLMINQEIRNRIKLSVGICL